MLNDGWDEQIVKRGWTTWEFPNVLEPRPTWGWAAMLVGAAVVWLAAYRVRP
jgi:hypothetical protein